MSCITGVPRPPPLYRPTRGPPGGRIMRQTPTQIHGATRLIYAVGTGWRRSGRIVACIEFSGILGLIQQKSFSFYDLSFQGF